MASKLLLALALVCVATAAHAYFLPEDLPTLDGPHVENGAHRSRRDVDQVPRVVLYQNARFTFSGFERDESVTVRIDSDALGSSLERTAPVHADGTGSVVIPVGRVARDCVVTVRGDDSGEAGSMPVYVEIQH